MPQIDAVRIAALLTESFGLQIIASEVEMDGGVWPSIRPATPTEPNGFSVVLGRAPRLATALFRPDRFAAALVHTMADADKEARADCIGQVQLARETGIRVLMNADDRTLGSDEDILPRRWKNIGIECEKRHMGSGAVTSSDEVRVASACLGIALSLLPLEENQAADEPGLPEGARFTTFVNRYERSAVNRAACLAHHGISCAGCGFRFEDAYGPVASGYIEVHHLTPVSQMGGAYRINPGKDLIPLCANCHAVVHRRTPPLAIDELRTLLGRT